jgi:hypothetical protein
MGSGIAIATSGHAKSLFAPHGKFPPVYRAMNLRLQLRRTRSRAQTITRRTELRSGALQRGKAAREKRS